MLLSASTTCHLPRSQHSNHGSILLLLLLLFLLPALLHHFGLTCLYREDKTEADFDRVLPHWSHVLGRRLQCALPCLEETTSFKLQGTSSLSFNLFCPIPTLSFDSDTQEISTIIFITPFWSYGQDLHRFRCFHSANASRHITKRHRVLGATAS